MIVISSSSLDVRFSCSYPLLPLLCPSSLPNQRVTKSLTQIFLEPFKAFKYHSPTSRVILTDQHPDIIQDDWVARFYIPRYKLVDVLNLFYFLKFIYSCNPLQYSIKCTSVVSWSGTRGCCSFLHSYYSLL